ncbi:LAFE_0A04610g1_1 [Lachancea fermentati]|uniref:LAFE_0A04610g1_1 n=1 Tax=Lachancea fermentati TaxID=4955 RepID=A0A1G4M6V4_LACFM|nr:LAFE_0A04610g1_1 [Lachancea fermentati]
MRLHSDGYEEIDEGGNKRKSLLVTLTKVGVLLVLLIWGTVIVLKTVNGIVHQPLNRPKNRGNSRTTKDGHLKVSFANVRNNTFTPKIQPLQWISGPNSTTDDNGLFVTHINDSYVVKSVFDPHYSKTLFKGHSFLYGQQNLTVDTMIASPDLQKVIIRTNTTKNWRHSTFGSYFVFSTEKSEYQMIGENISVVEWSPNSIDIAYVLDNDLYLYSVEKQKTTKRITDDGSAQVFNGKPDWVYEEEVLEGDSAMWWSPEGDYLSFFKTNETEVYEFPIPYFVQHSDDVYPEVRMIKYPKSGSPNPVVHLNIYDLEKERTMNVNIDDDSVLITDVLWVGAERLLARVTDRTSDILSMVLVDAKKDAFYEVPRVEFSDDGWWEITHDTLYVPKDKSRDRHDDGYLDVVPINGYNHLVYFSSCDLSNPVILTDGDWEVVDGPAAFDYESNDVYFLATKKSSMERHLYSVNIHKPLVIKEITDTSKDGYFDVTFSSGSRFTLLTYRGPDVPFQKIIDLRSSKTDETIHGNVVGKTLYYLETNEELKGHLESYAIPRITYQELNLGTDEKGNQILVNSYEILPNDFNPRLEKHYPVFFFGYGGPGSQQVAKTFSVGFNQVVASQLNAIVVVVDGRGTGFKGREFRSLVRDNLGDYEAQDQISAAALYAKKSFVDEEKISLFGWSYGGYLTLKTLEKDAGKHFKYGMSVAPVTDWRLYDSVYTERYMHTPQQNPEGYASAKVHNATALGEAKRFLLVHGTGDDNVHFQNSLKFLDMLDIEGIENYDVHVFPDSDHSIRYHNANTIVFDKLLNWAKQAFEGHFISDMY